MIQSQGSSEGAGWDGCGSDGTGGPVPLGAGALPPPGSPGDVCGDGVTTSAAQMLQFAAFFGGGRGEDNRGGNP
ncbi:hypothetical protein, partial [Kocuria tytonicola]|uniref:hypothetical protein n=1 Tax=Kocuria tytonicola TaxID=2055946 RepID=UPI00198059E6